MNEGAENQRDPISIHALREEGDYSTTGGSESDVLFLSTPSARRATARPARINTHNTISIHALREEGDEEYGNLVTALSISIHALREEGDVSRSDALT